MVAAGTSTQGGNLPTNDPTSGTLAFTDVDLTDKHTKTIDELLKHKEAEILEV